MFRVTQTKKRLFLGCFFLAITLLVTRLYFHSGFPYTHDGENHLARFAAYKIALREGQLPPRWAGNLLNHYGLPVFNFNYPLANIISLPFSLFKVEYELTYKLIVMSFVLLGVVGTFLWCREQRLSLSASLVASAVFASQPFLANLLYFRGGVGEILAFCLFPCLSWMIVKISNENQATSLRIFIGFLLLVVAFLLSHNGSAVFGTVILLSYAWFVFGKNIKSWLKLGTVLLMAVLLTLWFWLPAVAEMSWTALDSSGVNRALYEHFVTIDQLLFSPLNFGYSVAGDIDSLSFQLGALGWLALVLATVSYCIVPDARVAKHSKLMLASIGLCWTMVLLQTEASRVIWSFGYDLLKYVQFPWRLAFFWSIFVLPVVAWVFQSSRAWLKLLFLIFLGVQFAQVLNLKAVDYFHRTSVDYEAFTQTTTVQNENKAKNFAYEAVGDWQPTAEILSGRGKVLVRSWSGTKHIYTLDLDSSSVIVEPTMWFPGWQSYVSLIEGKLRRKSKLIEYEVDEASQGRISYRLDEGHYYVESRFTQWTWSRVVGNFISLVAGVGVVIWIIRKRPTSGKPMAAEYV